MNATDFVYWLQGFVELTETSTINEKQWLVIKDHLKLVFDKQTPDRSKDPSTITEIKADEEMHDIWEKWYEVYGKHLDRGTFQPLKLEDLYPNQPIYPSC